MLSNSVKAAVAAASALFLGILGLIFFGKSDQSGPLVYVANYGPHSSLHETIDGIKSGLNSLGHKDVRLKVTDINFEQSMIPQMISKAKAEKPDVLVTISTPVSQNARNMVSSIPMVFVDVMDPVEAGLMDSLDKPGANVTAASDLQDVGAVLDFAQKLLPGKTRCGFLHATGEANDLACLEALKKAAKRRSMSVMAVPVDQARDVPVRVLLLKDKVDFIYVNTSGAIQPSLPVIASETEKMKIPVINSDSDAVKGHLVLASFGVKYFHVGLNAAKAISQILKGSKASDVATIFPAPQDHSGFVSLKVAKKLGINVPSNLENTTYLE